MFARLPNFRPPGCSLPRTGALCVALALLTLSPERSRADLPQEQRARLIALSTAAREQIDPQRFPAAQEAKAEVLAAVAAVSSYLDRRTDAQNGAAWLDYIAADPLVEAIQGEASAEELTTRAREVRGRLIGDIPGLELAALRQLRASTERLINTARFEDPERAEQLVEQQLQALAQRIETADDLTSPEDAAALSTIIGMLHHANQAPELVAAVRSAFSRPNLVINIGGHVIEAAIARPVGETRPVRDCILGTTIIGTGYLDAQVVGKLAPCHGRVQVDLVLSGRFNSNTVGYNGPVRLPTVGQGWVTASRSLWIDETQRSLSPTTATASLNSTITSIDHPWRLVRKIAAKQINRQQPQAERIASNRLRSQVAADFDRQTREAVNGGGAGPLALAGGPMALAGGSGRLAGGSAGLGGGLLGGEVNPLQRIRTTLTRLNLPAPARTLGSTTQSVYVQATQRAETQLAASSAPPALAPLLAAVAPAEPTLVSSRKPAPQSPPERYAAAIQVHESVVDNVASRILAGRTVTGKQIDRLLDLGGKPPTSSEDPEADEPFEIDFSNFRPIILELRNQSVRLGLRGTRFSQGGRELVRPLEITATYEPEQLEDGTMILRRRGEVQVDYPGTRRLTVQQVVVRRTIQVLFVDRFPETLLDRPLVVPAAGGLPFLSIRTLRTQLIDARDGWITVAIQ